MNILLITEKTYGHMSNLLAISKKLTKINYNPIFIINNSKTEQTFVNYNKLDYYLYKNILNFNNILKETCPKCLISSGGRFSLLIVNLAKVKNIPCYILEPNYYPGLTNIINSVDSTVLMPNDDYKKLFYTKIIKFNNPIRKNLGNKIKIQTNKKYKLFISGGTNGLKPLNLFILKNLKIFEDNDIFVIWQTGLKNDKIEYKSKNTLIKQFFDDIYSIYNVSDFIITTGGINTLNELINLRIPFISIPMDNSKYNHHIHNVIYLKNYINQIIFINQLEDSNLIYKIIDKIKLKQTNNNFDYQDNDVLYQLIEEQQINKQYFNFFKLIKILFLSIFLYFRSLLFYTFEKKIAEIKKILGEKYTNYNEIDPIFIKSIIIREDSNFFYHYGFPLKSTEMGFLIFKQIKTGKQQIFSGIYQQLIKNLYFEKNKSIHYNIYRKFTEYLLTNIFNYIYTKEQILEYYFNILLFIDYKSDKVNFFGINNISKNIFNKELDELNIFEISFISTTLTNPIYHFDLIKKNIITKKIFKRIRRLIENLIYTKSVDSNELNNLKFIIKNYKIIN